MSEHQQKQEQAIHAAREMTAALNEMSGRLNEAEAQRKVRDVFLTAYGRRNRILIWVTIVSLVLDVALTIAVTVALVGVHHNSASTTDLRNTSVAACVLGNQTRAQSIALWEHIFKVAKPRPGESRAQRTQAAKVETEFLAYVHRVYAPRNCPALYRLK